MGKIMLNGKQYGVGGIEKAKDISYDNTQSGLSATNVQGAVDELKSGLTQAPKISGSTASWVSSFNITLTEGIYLFVGGTSDLKTVEVYSNGSFAITNIYGSGWNVTGSNFVLRGTATSARWYSVIQINKVN